MEDERAANRLVGEASPYLLQHAHNPVDWYPWGEEAFERARREDRPIFLSIGYSTCHWCHVMERESFEDPAVARLLNEGFVPVKVDREERPDVDAIYMTACQMLTGRGGWPLTIVTTPERRPFFAGTYFPKRSRGGRVGLLDLLPRLGAVWRERREDAVESAERITEALVRAGEAAVGEGRGVTGPEAIHEAREQLEAMYDEAHGGFGGAPKFPSPHNLLFLLRCWWWEEDARAVEMVSHTLRRMRRGGIWDQLGGGFHRYSTDARWLVPHFEKMLYDQAMLCLACTEAHQVTGDAELADTARGICEYVGRELRDPQGGFYSAEDADSEGREGAFYLWTTAEVEERLGRDDAALACAAFGLREGGNFVEEASGISSGENILHRPRSLAELAEERGVGEAELARRLQGIRRRLFEAREERPRPALDDKVLTDWNGLMIAACARAGRVLGEPALVEMARAAAEFALRELVDPSGRLLHRYRKGRAGLTATLDDHAFLVWGLIELYESGFDPRHLSEALRLTGEMRSRFGDESRGGFFLAAADAEPLLVRQKEFHDGALPSGNSVALLDLVRLSRLTGDASLAEAAERLLSGAAGAVARAPVAHTFLLAALGMLRGVSTELVIAGPEEDAATAELLAVVRGAYLPDTVVLRRPPDSEGGERVVALAPFVEAMPGERAAAYLCRDFACQSPITEPAELRAALEARADRRGGATQDPAR